MNDFEAEHNESEEAEYIDRDFCKFLRENKKSFSGVFPRKDQITICDHEELSNIRKALGDCDVEFFKDYFKADGKPYLCYFSCLDGVKTCEASKLDLDLDAKCVPILSLAAPLLNKDPDRRHKYSEIVGIAAENGLDINACTSQGVRIIEGFILDALTTPQKDITEAIKVLHEYGATFDINDDVTALNFDILMCEALDSYCLSSYKNKTAAEKTSFDALTELFKGDNPVISGRLALKDVNYHEAKCKLENLLIDLGIDILSLPDTKFHDYLTKLDIFISKLAPCGAEENNYFLIDRLGCSFMYGLGQVNLKKNVGNDSGEIAKRANTVIDLLMRHFIPHKDELLTDILVPRVKTLEMSMEKAIRYAKAPSSFAKKQAKLMSEIMCQPNFTMISHKEIDSELVQKEIEAARIGLQKSQQEQQDTAAYTFER